MKTFISVFVAGLVVALATGCNNSNNSTASAPSTNAAMDYGNTLVNSKKTADKTIDVSYINQAIQLYGTQEGHLPKTLQVHGHWHEGRTLRH